MVFTENWSLNSSNKMNKQIKIERRNEFGRYIKGSKSERKGKSFPQIKGENHYKWKGGTHATARRMAIGQGVDLSTCWICKKKVKTMIHHINGNEYDNCLKNWGVVCCFCHNAIHDNSNRRKTRFKIGHSVSLEVRGKISMANKGQIPWNKGMKIDREKYPNMGNFKVSGGLI